MYSTTVNHTTYQREVFLSSLFTNPFNPTDMKATIIKNYYSANGGTNNVTVYQVYQGYCMIQSFRGVTAEKRASQLVNRLNK